MKTYWENVVETRWRKYTIEIDSVIILERAEIAMKPIKDLEVGCDGGGN